VQDDIREGRLVHLLPDWQPAALPVHLVYPWSRYYPARLRRFLELMRQVMPEVTGMRKPVQQP
ncbi:MAG: LysR substrate-binding domain-containing protein, partial [Enterobacter sp.]|nr:LysR substrate-binding domain-containing protein [Enterobacter sp.]